MLWRPEKKVTEKNICILDNECSAVMNKLFTKNDVTFRLIPPYTHRRNTLERAVCNFKNHICTVITLCEPNFPKKERDRLIIQAIITLNVLHSSQTNLSLSEYAAIHGNFGFNATPMAPPGTKIPVHEKSTSRASFANHVVDGWYIVPCLDDYWCFRCYIIPTWSTRNSDTAKLSPKTIPFLYNTTENYLWQAAEDIISIISRKYNPLQHLHLEFHSPTHIYRWPKYFDRDSIHHHNRQIQFYFFNKYHPKRKENCIC